MLTHLERWRVVVRNPEEEMETRLAAYMSLELVHGGERTSRAKATSAVSRAEGDLSLIDWSFVDSFL